MSLVWRGCKTAFGNVSDRVIVGYVADEPRAIIIKMDDGYRCCVAQDGDFNRDYFGVFANPQEAKRECNIEYNRQRYEALNYRRPASPGQSQGPSPASHSGRSEGA